MILHNKDELVAGYQPDDLLKAPTKPPNQKMVESKIDTTNPNVRFVVLSGALIAFIGIILFAISSMYLGFLIAIIGAALAAYGVFAPLK